MYDPDPLIPPRIFFSDRDFDSADALMVNIYSDYLRKSDEPSLWKNASNPNYHAYRLLIEIALKIEGVAIVRITINEHSTAHIESKTLRRVWTQDNKGRRWEHLEIIDHSTLNVPPYQLDQLLYETDRSNFWHLPVLDERLGADGSSWYIEGAKSGQYHLVERWVPNNPEFIRLAVKMLELGGLDTWQDWAKRHGNMKFD
jgi:hypothetical protein